MARNGMSRFRKYRFSGNVALHSLRCASYHHCDHSGRRALRVPDVSVRVGGGLYPGVHASLQFISVAPRAQIRTPGLRQCTRVEAMWQHTILCATYPEDQSVST